MDPASFKCAVCQLQCTTRSYIIHTRERNFLIGSGLHLEPNSRMCPKCYMKTDRTIARIDQGREENILQPGEVLIKTVPKAQHQCCVCKSKQDRKAIPVIAAARAWSAKQILIPDKNRSCAIHLENETFTADALELLSQRSSDKAIAFTDFQNTMSGFMHCLDSQEKVQVNHGIDFDNERMSDEQYRVHTGYTKSQFDQILVHVRQDLRNSTNRSVRNALGIFLAKLRMDLTQEQLGQLFSLDQQRVSDVFDAVLESCYNRIVPLFLGFEHITREELIEKHQTTMSTALTGLPPGSAGMLGDGTYWETQKSSNMDAQKALWSEQKHYNLLKPMIICAPDGYILDVNGPYLGKHNDAEILEHMLQEGAPFANFIRANDVLVLDRGFLRVKDLLESMGIIVMMPNFLRGKSQFSTQEANESRLVTKIRWPVEGVNGRIQNRYTFLRNRMPNSYMKKAAKIYKVACALLNMFFVPLKVDREEDEDIALRMLGRVHLENELMSWIIEGGYDKQRAVWKRPELELFDFPRLTEDDIRYITLGEYQLRNARGYTGLHTANRQYKFFVHREFVDLLRVKMRSRFVSQKIHNVWIRYQPGENGADSIVGYYCTCQNGARTVGTCSHVAATIWFFGYGRHIPNLRHPAADILDNVIDLRN